MKTKVLFIAVCSVIALYSCSGSLNPAKLFTKKWQLESIKSKAMDDRMAQLKMEADTTKDSTMKAMDLQQIQSQGAMTEMLKNMTFEYRGDGTYQTSVSVFGQTQNSNGKWTLIADGKKVITTDDKGKIDTMTINKMTSDTLIVSSSDNTISMTFKPAKS
jgi:hypothetical protein